MFLKKSQIAEIGFKSYGENLLISDAAKFYRPENIEIGNNVRIDDFCILSAGIGGIVIGSNIHIACYVSMIGAGKITLEDFANVSNRCSILSSNDDYSGEYLIGPTVEREFRNVIDAPVTIRKHGLIGAGSHILPGVTIGYNSCVGSLSLVKKDVPDNQIHAGIPAKLIKLRKTLLEGVAIF